jgi:enoyl-CoA hydratase/carnithine racemase
MADTGIEVQDGVALIRFLRPERMNTFSAGMIAELGEHYRACDADPSVRVVVLTGSGTAFCAGADMSDAGVFVATGDDPPVSSCPLSFQAWDLRKPVIAACNGHAIGIGLGIALQCDMRVFAIEGKYGVLQNRRGVVADFGVEYLLPRITGLERAFELLVRGNRLDGAEAREWGLCARAVPAEEVLPLALGIAQDMARNCSPLVMGMHKRLLLRGLDMPREELVGLETRALAFSMRCPDAREGGDAWAGKRSPQWRDLQEGDWPEFL